MCAHAFDLWLIVNIIIEHPSCSPSAGGLSKVETIIVEERNGEWARNFEKSDPLD